MVGRFRCLGRADPVLAAGLSTDVDRREGARLAVGVGRQHEYLWRIPAFHYRHAKVRSPEVATWRAYYGRHAGTRAQSQLLRRVADLPVLPHAGNDLDSLPPDHAVRSGLLAACHAAQRQVAFALPGIRSLQTTIKVVHTGLILSEAKNDCIHHPGYRRNRPRRIRGIQKTRPANSCTIRWKIYRPRRQK